MLNAIDGILTILLGLLAVFGGWLHCVDDHTPPVNSWPRLGFLGLQLSRIRPLGWWLLGAVVTCMGLSLGIHARNDYLQDQQFQALTAATGTVKELSLSNFRASFPPTPAP